MGLEVGAGLGIAELVGSLFGTGAAATGAGAAALGTGAAITEGAGIGAGLTAATAAGLVGTEVAGGGAGGLSPAAAAAGAGAESISGAGGAGLEQAGAAAAATEAGSGIVGGGGFPTPGGVAPPPTGAPGGGFVSPGEVLGGQGNFEGIMRLGGPIENQVGLASPSEAAAGAAAGPQSGIGEFATSVLPFTDPTLSPVTQALEGSINATAGGAATEAGGAAATPAASSSLFGKATEALSSPWISRGVPLAMLGSTLLRGKESLPASALQANQLGLLQKQFAESSLSKAEAGQITPEQQAQIDIWRQNEMNRVYQLYAGQGKDPRQSSDYVQAINQIEQQAVAMRAQFINQLITQGLTASGGATAALNQTANLQIQEDKEFQDSIGNAAKALGLAAGIGARPAAAA